MLDRLYWTMMFQEQIIMAMSSTVSNISILHARNEYINAHEKKKEKEIKRKTSQDTHKK